METVEARSDQNGPAGLESSLVDVQTTSTVTAPGPPNTTVTKVIVAVHGVGDQHNYATIQSVANQFCTFYGHPAAIPLGNFHTGRAAFSLQPPYPKDTFERFAFAEVYWAKFPRALADEKHTLEEAKKWAGTIVERLRLRSSKDPAANRAGPDFHLVNQVLVEMIQTIAVVERLCFLADKAGIFTFDLRKMLDDYLGDVQVVTEFEAQRGEILTAFAELMNKIDEAFPNAEIYLVTHSEGTVVSFLGLLKAFRAAPAPGWTERVRGLMTLGSPIDKHLALWPELFGDTPPAKRDPGKPRKKIEWRNYYDYGDPIGFALDDARKWLKANEWDDVFNFADEHDFGFTRYPFPGKAHVDYWTDKDVFVHFIDTVVNAEPGAAPGTPTKPAKEPAPPPRDKPRTRLLSYVVPYAGVAALLFVAAYILFKAVTGAMKSSLDLPTIVGSVAGLAGLLLGITVVARVPRLTRVKRWRAIAFGVGLLSAVGYMWSASWGTSITLKGYSIPPGARTLALAVSLVVVVYFLSAKRPHWGVKPLMFLGALAVVATVASHLRDAKSVGEIGPLWPVFLATFAFLYLWWLAALLFDLVFVWHLYIRNAKLIEWMHGIVGSGYERNPEPSPATA